MKSKREIARSSRAMTNGAFTAMTGRSSFQRMIKGLAAFLMALALVFGFASCKTESEEETVYRTVTYSTEHATAPEKLTVTDGTALTAEQLPSLTAEGYTFGGWYDGETKAEAGYKVTKDVTLTAKWTKNTVTPTPDDGEDDGGNTSENTKYTVTFSTNGGTAVESQKIESGKTATEPTAPTKDGYIFGGWFTDSNFATAFTFSTAITADITLYAKWIEASKPTYTVTFSTDGAETKQIVAEGEKAVKPADPTKEGCTFAGWFNGESAFDFETAITENITLTAKWTLITYTVTFTTNGGTEVASQKIENGKTATEPASLTKEGFTFGGWFTDSGLTAAFTFNTPITADITLYAKWIESSKPTYTVTFTVDGTETKQTVADGEKAVKPADPTKTGYTFDGWYKDDTKFDFETTVTANLTLTAKWTLITYTITYEGLNGAANPNTATSYTVESEAITLQNPTRTGYIFNGWFDAETGGNKIESIAKGSTEAKTLYAHWTAISYEITYVLPNGVTNPNVTSYTIESNTITLQSPARTGYTFNGWYDAETGGNKVESIVQGSTGAKTLYAQWTLITYTITYEGLNGAANPNTATSYTVETETITLQDFSLDDYTFEGWFDAETGGNKVISIPKGSTGNKTLYAHCTWKWIGAKNPTTAKAVGDIVFSDGSATPYSTDLALSTEQKAAAVAVIFYAGSASDTLGAKTLGVGLKNAIGESNNLAWAKNETTGYNTNFTDIQCTRSETTPSDGTAYYSYTSSRYVTGDFDGSDNWEKVCAADSTASETAATNYPAFNWVNNYGNSLTGDMATGWYLPSAVEFLIMCGDKATVNAALEAAGGTKIADTSYWSSNQYPSDTSQAYCVWFDGGYPQSAYKAMSLSVCAVRAF